MIKDIWPFGNPCPCGFYGNSYARHHCKMKENILKNAPFDLPNTISIRESDPEWPAAYANWINGKPPTNSSLWKKGIYFGSIEKRKLVLILVEEDDLIPPDPKENNTEFSNWWFLLIVAILMYITVYFVLRYLH